MTQSSSCDPTTALLLTTHWRWLCTHSSVISAGSPDRGLVALIWPTKLKKVASGRLSQTGHSNPHSIRLQVKIDLSNFTRYLAQFHFRRRNIVPIFNRPMFHLKICRYYAVRDCQTCNNFGIIGHDSSDTNWPMILYYLNQIHREASWRWSHQDKLDF